MEQQTVRKTYKYKLKPTPEQERELGRVLGLCRWLYNTALGATHHRPGSERASPSHAISRKRS